MTTRDMIRERLDGSAQSVLDFYALNLTLAQIRSAPEVRTTKLFDQEVDG